MTNPDDPTPATIAMQLQWRVKEKCFYYRIASFEIVNAAKKMDSNVKVEYYQKRGTRFIAFTFPYDQSTVSFVALD